MKRLVGIQWAKNHFGKALPTQQVAFDETKETPAIVREASAQPGMERLSVTWPSGEVEFSIVVTSSEIVPEELMPVLIDEDLLQNTVRTRP